jgi:hypothetical protein
MKKWLPAAAYLIFSMLSTLFLATCKEYSFEGGNKAEYTFISSAGNCTGSILTGQYYEGVLLGANNTIRLQVNVTKLGQYNITTTTVDGMQFSVSGEFTVAGTQTVSLQGAGTPSTQGDFTFSTPGTSACTFVVSVTPKPVINAEYSLAGAPDNCQDPAFTGKFTYGVSISNTSTVILKVHVTSQGAYSIRTDTVNGIYFTASGTFTATGDQTVTLSGSGTPNIPGNFYFKPSSGNSTCSFKLSVQNPEPLATYVLESGSGTPNPCVYTVEGNYNTSNALNNSNTVTIRVYVTVPGNFTISTNSVNGMMFTYTGTFAATGLQYVALEGSGTPTAAGTFMFAPEIVGPHPIGGASCAFNIVVN